MFQPTTPSILKTSRTNFADVFTTSCTHQLMTRAVNTDRDCNVMARSEPRSLRNTTRVYSTGSVFGGNCPRKNKQPPTVSVVMIAYTGWGKTKLMDHRKMPVWGLAHVWVGSQRESLEASISTSNHPRVHHPINLCVPFVSHSGKTQHV